MTIQTGERLPNSTVYHMTGDGPTAIESDELFAKGKVILVAVPGAFTPTCHNKHIPGFLDNASALREKGVDKIFCIAINDPFVMSNWGKHLGAGDDISFVSDGNGTFTKAIGMGFDGGAIGLATRSKRFVMLLEEGIVKTLNVDDNSGEADASSAERLLEML